ncbi:MAG: mandelate racemase/muconate lactonizing enzyme family protein [Planctomycetes bacterium]|nr:mandelate racemase/muconate lactonizing enzyme family protein [Planctomycetota bacterium]
MSDAPKDEAYSRRQAITTMAGVAAGAVILNEAVKAADNPAANVADKASTIKIKSLQTFPAGPKVFIKIETNHGITGWGEIDQLEPVAATALVKSLFELIDGENPTRIEHLWQKVFRSHRDMRGGPFMVHTIAAIDMALWDIAGKLWNTPVYRLLGGPTRDKILCYPSAKATKVGAGPAEFSGTPKDFDRYLNLLADARKRVGPDGMVMFDAHCALPPPFLMQLASKFDPFEVLYIEEAAVPGNIEVFRRLKQHIKIPLAIGERDRTIWEFIPYLQEGIADILQVDCAHTGGITQVKKIAALAEAYHVPLAPHAVTSDLGVSASFHVSAAIPFFLIHEYYPTALKNSFLKKNWKVDDTTGYATLPEGPGLGVEVDEAALKEFPKTYKGVWKWPLRGFLKDGSIADY